jgi:zinc/manganese transport system permease protein
LGGYESLLFGSFLGITKAQVWTLGIVAAATLVALWIVGRPLLFCSIDAKVARARGVPAKALGFGFLLILGMAVAETAQITGALLVFTLLIGPPATARLITARIGLGIAISVTGAIAIAWASLALSYFYGHPVGFYMGTLALGAYLTALAGRALAERSS